jgi:hypothetical protein
VDLKTENFVANIHKLFKARDYNAMDACLRAAGFMKDRRAPRGGARNFHQEYLEDAMSEEMVCDFCGKSAEALRRIALDDGYDRITTKSAPMYACEPCSTEKEQTRLGLRRKRASVGF